jgi:molybdopterin-synthase adenylyltransferase
VTPSRYQRQIVLPGIGDQGQARLAAARVVIVGVGALGCASAEMLTRAGAGLAAAGGWLALLDRDVVEFTNLQRQCLYTEADARAGLPKVEAAAARLAAINSEVALRPLAADLTSANALRLLGCDQATGAKPSLIIDGTDNFATRFLLNDIAVKFQIPFCYAGVVAGAGTQATFIPGQTGCLRCLLPTPPDPSSLATCDTAGVLAPAVQIVAGAQVADAIKILTGNEARLSHSVLSFDLWTNRRTRIAIPKPDPACPCCGQRIFEFLNAPADDELARLCGQNSVQVAGHSALDLALLAQRLEPWGGVARSGVMLRFDPADLPTTRFTIFADGRAIVRGTTDPARARSLYARYIGA